MSKSTETILLPCNNNINVEENIRLKLAEKLSFSPEYYYFSYKKKGDQIVVSYKTNQEESLMALTERVKKIMYKRFLCGLLILLLLALFNFIVLKVRDNNFIAFVKNRQLIKNNQYHFHKDVALARDIKLHNNNFFKRVDSFLQQPIQINNIIIEEHSVALEGYIFKKDFLIFRDILEEHKILDKTLFQDKREKLWVLVKNI